MPGINGEWGEIWGGGGGRMERVKRCVGKSR